MEVTIMNSINLENIQNDYSLTNRRVFSNSDLELDYSNINKNNNNEEEGSNNINNSNNRNEDSNINNDNIINESQISESNLGDSIDNSHINEENNNHEANNNNNNESSDFSISNTVIIVQNRHYNLDDNDEEILNKDLIKDLKNNNFIFIKDYYNQKIDENNKSYVSWLKKIYEKLYFSEYKDNTMKNHINISQKFETPDYPILKKEIEKYLYFCENPKCNAIVYMTKEQEKQLDKIEDLIFTEGLEEIKHFDKKRCPICLCYKCIFCKRTSTLLNANCCISQLNWSVSDYNHSLYYGIFKFALFTPIIRECYMASMINFALFRGLTFRCKLLQNKEEIERKVANGITSDFIFGSYQSKFSRISLFFISLLNILGSICWALPFIIYCEIFLVVIMFLGFCKILQYYKILTNYFYLLAFIPGLRRGQQGRIPQQHQHHHDQISDNSFADDWA